MYSAYKCTICTKKFFSCVCLAYKRSICIKNNYFNLTIRITLEDYNFRCCCCCSCVRHAYTSLMNEVHALSTNVFAFFWFVIRLFYGVLQIYSFKREAKARERQKKEMKFFVVVQQQQNEQFFFIFFFRFPKDHVITKIL